MTLQLFHCLCFDNMKLFWIFFFPGVLCQKFFHPVILGKIFTPFINFDQDWWTFWHFGIWTIQQYFRQANAVTWILTFFLIFSVPGDGGSQLEVKLNKPKVVSDICMKKSTEWSTLWLADYNLLPGTIAKFFDIF